MQKAPKFFPAPAPCARIYEKRRIYVIEIRTMPKAQGKTAVFMRIFIGVRSLGRRFYDKFTTNESQCSDGGESRVKRS